MAIHCIWYGAHPYSLELSNVHNQSKNPISDIQTASMQLNAPMVPLRLQKKMEAVAMLATPRHHEYHSQNGNTPITAINSSSTRHTALPEAKDSSLGLWSSGFQSSPWSMSPLAHEATPTLLYHPKTSVLPWIPSRKHSTTRFSPSRHNNDGQGFTLSSASL